MRVAIKTVLILATSVLLVSPAVASIQGTFSGNFAVGVDGGAGYSYVHAATSMPKSGDALYDQFAGGQVQYAIDPSPTVQFFFNDVGGDGLSDGDSLTFNNATVGLLTHDGSLDGTHTGSPAGILRLSGTLNIGGSHSSSAPSNFTHGISNIEAGNTDPGHMGLFYTITSLANDVLNTGEIFFQSGALAGPFNGIKYDETTETLSFAIWGNSLNKGGRESGKDAAGTNAPLGFDVFINAQRFPGSTQNVPEPVSLAVWSLLGYTGLIVRRRNASR